MASLNTTWIDQEIDDTTCGVLAERYALAGTIIARTLDGEPMLDAATAIADSSGWTVFELTLAVAEQLSNSHR